ncbi:LOW QUALITY PROTEIN: cilia- and flagella-associated protein 46 [Gastrophryne carolinensis]
MVSSFSYAAALLGAFKLIKAANRERSARDAPETFSADLYVLCAERAYELGDGAVSADCLQMYFNSNPPPNQYYGRAYLCQARLHAPLSAEDVAGLEKSVVYYMKAIDFANKQQRYHFLVYNASVLYWQTVRPFLKPGSRRLLTSSLAGVVKALADTDDDDKDWRADLMMELLECFLDAGRMKEAADCATLATEFIKANVPHKYPTLFSKMVHHKLIDPAKAAKEAKSSASLLVVFKIHKLRSQLDASLTTQEVQTSLTEIHELLLVGEGPSLQLPPSERIALLIELAHLSLELRCTPVASACIRDLKSSGTADSRTLIALECLESELEVLNLGARIKTYTKGVVQAQLRIVRRLEKTLQDALRLGEPIVIQAVCTSQWNICLPLLQHNLRKQLKKTLVSLSEALESIDSLLMEMRCQIYMEIAQMEDEEDRAELAIGQLQKALALNGDGKYKNFLNVCLHRLQLRAALYTKPQRAEDQAAMILEQAKHSDPGDSVRKKRPLLVNVGLCLAPDVFQMVLDSENESKVSTGKGRTGRVSLLCMKAQHHTKCVLKTEGHLSRTDTTRDTERARLWADLAKVARKQEVWDVCRTACRFCLLYDDGRWNVPTCDVLQKTKPTSSPAEDQKTSELETCNPATELFSDDKLLLRMLAEIRFINAEATIHLLKCEGCQMNESPTPPEDTSKRPASYVPKDLEEDSDWLAYKNWISQLSKYAMDNFLRASELGVELQEAWITHNAVVYILNYNKHIIASGKLSLLLKPLKKVLEAIKSTGHNGNPALLVTLSDILAKGLIHPWIPVSGTDKRSETSLHTEKSKKASGKAHEKSNAALTLSIDQNGLPDVKLALEVCEFSLELTNGSHPEDVVPIAIRHQLLATWVKVKQLLQQQIGPKLGTDDEENYNGQNLMSKVLVALEMHSCNGLGLMDFTVPSLSQVLKMTLDCHWSDRLVELQTLTRLAHFAYIAQDLELALTCARSALALDDDTKPQVRGSVQGCGMLSAAACIQGQSIMKNLAGKKHLRFAAIKAFETSARFGGEAGSAYLALQAAKHFWNACSPLIVSVKEREALKDSVILVIKALNEADGNYKKGPAHDTASFHLWPTKDAGSCNDRDPGNPQGESDGNKEEDLTLKAGLYELLFTIHADKNDWESGLKLLDEAIKLLPRTRHRLILFKHRVLVKARLGQNFFMDMQKFKDESEDYVSYIWHRVARNCRDTRQQLACYLNAIEALKKPESEWQKVQYLLELAEWLHCKQFPLGDAMKMLDWAVDILLHMKCSTATDEVGKNQKSKVKPKMRPSQNKDSASEEYATPSEVTMPRTGEPPASPGPSLEDLRNVRQLEALARAHTLMANLSGSGSPHHEQHSLLAYAFIMRIWQVSVAAAAAFMKSAQKNPPAAQKPPSAASHKEKAKKETGETVMVKEKSKRKGPTGTLPSNPEEWSGFDCPEELRDAFKEDSSSQVINKSTIPKPTYSLYYLDLLVKELQGISYTHLTLPVLHLAEVISLDVVESKSLSSLYHLKISHICGDLELYTAASYHQKAAGSVFISEYELISLPIWLLLPILTHIPTAVLIVFWAKERVVLILEESRQGMKKFRFRPLSSVGIITCSTLSEDRLVLAVHEDGKGLSGLSLPYLWLEKSDILIQLGYFQPARTLLSQAFKALQDIGDRANQMRCLHLLTELANCEKNHGQAISLLHEARDLERDAELLCETSLILTEAVLGEGKEGKERKAYHILDSSINVLKDTLPKERNRESMYHLLIAKLSARKFSIILKDAQSLIQSRSATSEAVATLLNLCDQMGQMEVDLLQSGHREYQAEFLMEHSNILRILAGTAENEERRHGYYLDSWARAERAISILEQIVCNIQSAFPIEVGGISLPVVRKLAKMKMDFGELSLEIMQLATTEERKRRQEEKRKGALRVRVEEFVRATPDYNSIDQEWKTLTRAVSSSALAQLGSALTLVGECNYLKARCLYLTGKCLLLQSFRIDPLDGDMYWNENYLDERKAMESQEDASTDWPDNNPQLSNQQSDQLARRAAALKARRSLAERLLAQSSALLQSINVAIENNLMDVLSAASLEICSCFGRFDPLVASTFLALHQSCSCCMMMEELVLTATRNTSSSQLAALLHLLKYLQKKGDQGPLQKLVKQKLANTSKVRTHTTGHYGAFHSRSPSCIVWESLQISAQHFNIFNDLPPNFNVLILQHSEDRSFLYGALLEKPKVGPPQKGKSTQLRATQAKVTRCSVDPQKFSSLLEKMELFKQDASQHLLKEEHQQTSTKRKNVFHGNSDPAMVETNHLQHENVNRGNIQFNEIVEALESYLRPVLLQLEFLPPRQPSPSLSTSESVREKSREKQEKPATPSTSSVEVGDYTVVLADISLHHLPLEALAVFKDDSINSMSRDFSLQLLYNRIHRQQAEEAEGKRDAKSAKQAKQKKNIKVVPIDRVLPANCISVETHRFKYVVDPYNEIKEPETISPAYKMKEVLVKYGQQFTPYWEGITGSTRVPSLAEWENLMTDCSAFIFYGPERFLAYVMLDKLLAINLTECQLMVLLDQMRSSRSFLRQSTIDVQKSKSQLSLERPAETALLLSAAGVRSILLNQWAETADHNARRLDLLSEYLLALGKTTGQTLRSLQKLKGDSEVTLKEGETSEEKHGELTNAHHSRLPAGDPSYYNSALYGLPNMVVIVKEC